jgi:prolyl-tRNA editing enzyme YbaK/EbsC (Cys-tRNA(Pro) deacylase)
MEIGSLAFDPALSVTGRLAPPVTEALRGLSTDKVFAASIDDNFADTAAFCEHYGIGLDISANCVVVEARRGDRTWYAACMILATDRADVNGVVRRHLDARKISFAPMDTATRLTQMECGGITPIGLPKDWPLLVDTGVAESDYVIIGSGLRSSKLAVPGSLLASLPAAAVLNLAKAS